MAKHGYVFEGNVGRKSLECLETFESTYSEDSEVGEEEQAQFYTARLPVVAFTTCIDSEDLRATSISILALESLR